MDKTLQELNAELDAARGALERRNKLRSVRGDLAAQREERRLMERETARVLRSEHADVERLEKLSLASLLASLKGDKAEALARERREEDQRLVLEQRRAAAKRKKQTGKAATT